MARLEGKWVFILLFREHIVRGAELLDRGIIKACAFLHFRSDQQALSLDLGHFGLDVPAAADCQGISRDISAVETQHAGDGIPEGGLAVSAIAVGNNECFHIDLPNDGQTADHLHIVDQLLILLEDKVQVVLPELLAFAAGRYRGYLRNEVVSGVLAGTGQTFPKIIGRFRCTEQEAVRVQVPRRDFQHRVGLLEGRSNVLGVTPFDRKALICLGGKELLIGLHLLIVHKLFGLGL